MKQCSMLISVFSECCETNQRNTLIWTYHAITWNFLQQTDNFKADNIGPDPDRFWQPSFIILLGSGPTSHSIWTSQIKCKMLILSLKAAPSYILTKYHKLNHWNAQNCTVILKNSILPLGGIRLNLPVFCMVCVILSYGLTKKV